MRKTTNPWLLFIFTLFIKSMAFANVTEISSYRHNQFVQPFLGTYVAEDNLGREKLVSIWANENGLFMWEVDGIPTMATQKMGFFAPFENHSKTKFHRGSGVLRNRGIKSNSLRKEITEYEVVSSKELVVRITEFDEDGIFRHKSVEKQSLILNGNTLSFLFERTFYRKKHGITGEWVQDFSYNAKRNTRSSFVNYTKINRTPIPVKELKEIARDRDNRFWSILKEQGRSQAVSEYDVWEKNDDPNEAKAYADKIYAQERLRSESADIIEFPQNECDHSLK